MTRLSIAMAVVFAGCGPMNDAEPGVSEQALGTVTILEAEYNLIGYPAAVVGDSNAVASRAVRMPVAGQIHGWVTLPAVVTTLTLRTRADLCGGVPQMRVFVNDVQRQIAQVNSATWTTITAQASLAAGTHYLVIEYDNDVNLGCDGALLLDEVTFSDDGSYVPPPPYVGDVTSFEAEDMTGASTAIISDSAASMTRARRAGTNATMSTTVTLAQVATTVTVTARGEPCNGAPQMKVLVDGVQRFHGFVSTTTYASQPMQVPLSIGSHSIAISYDNELTSFTCDRALVVDKVRISSDGTYVPPPSYVMTEAENFTTIGTSLVYADSTASNGRGLWFVGNTTASTSVSMPGPLTSLTVTARGDTCGATPQMVVKIDGVTVLTTSVSATAWSTIPITLASPMTGASHTVAISYPNDSNVGCNGALRVDKVTLRAN